MKTFATTLTIMLGLCAPALADDAAAPVGVKVTLTSGADKRVYELSLLENGCGKTTEKAADREDIIDVCARAIAAGKTDLRLDVDWSTVARTGERRGHTSVVLARGASAVVTSANGFRVDVTAQ